MVPDHLFCIEEVVGLHHSLSIFKFEFSGFLDNNGDCVL
jgi:hypothetical protein